MEGEHKMISISDFQDILATAFLDGNMSIAGIVIYAAVLMLLFALTRNTTQTLVISLPVTLIFSLLGILSNDVMILMIIVTVLGLAFTTRDIWRA